MRKTQGISKDWHSIQIIRITNQSILILLRERDTDWGDRDFPEMECVKHETREIKGMDREVFPWQGLCGLNAEHKRCQLGACVCDLIHILYLLTVD